MNRKGQKEAADYVRNWYYNSDKQFLIYSGPTGIGKTAVAASMVEHVDVLALARTKVLLESNYKDSYDFDQLQGKNNHPCRLSPNTHRADSCVMPDSITYNERYESCMGCGSCSYYLERDRFVGSNRGVTTYAKFMDDSETTNNPSLFVMDEAHELPALITERSGIDIDFSNTKKHPYLSGFGELPDNDNIDRYDALELMRAAYAFGMDNKPVLLGRWDDLTPVQQVNYKNRTNRHNRFIDNLKLTGRLVSDTNVPWHFHTKGNTFSGKPMSASYYFKRMLDIGDTKTILMSATINPFIAEMLGIKGEFDFYESPQQYPARMRPIYDLNQPGMGYSALKKNPGLWRLQAIRISNIIKSRPEVSSVILTSSKSKARIISDNLRSLGIDAFMPSVGVGTDEQLREWGRYRKPGSTCVSWNFWEGVSLDEDKMLFIASIKFPDLSNPFEKAKKDYNQDEFLYTAAIFLVQGCGRIQRGYFEDYLPLSNKQVYLADGNYKMLLKHTPGDFKQRIVKF